MPASQVFNAMPEGFHHRLHAHACTPQSGEQKPQREQSKLSASHQAAGGGVLNVVGCSGEDFYMLRRPRNTAATSSRANWLLRRMEIALHCIGYVCRFTSRMQNAKQAKFGISHASEGRVLRPTLAAAGMDGYKGRPPKHTSR